MEKLNSFIKSIEKKMLIVMMTIMVILGFLQIISRFVIKKPITWSEGVLTYMFIWTIYISASLGIEEKIHFGIDYFVKKLPDKAAKYLEVFTNVIILGFALFVVYQGSYIAYFGRNQMMPALPYRMTWAYSALPVFALFSIVHIINNIKKLVIGGC